MKHIRTLSLCALAMSLLATPASAQSNDAVCEAYGKFGAALVDFMLPLKMQDFVDMMTGRNPDLLQEMTGNLLSRMDGNDILTLTQLGQGEAEILGEAAGIIAIETLMSGQAADAKGVATIMTSACNAVGYETIISSQRQANDAAKVMQGG